MLKERMIMIIIVNPTIEPNSYIIQYLSNSSYDHHQYTREFADVSYNTIIIELRIINNMFSTTQHHARQDQTGISKLTYFMGIYNSSIPPENTRAILTNKLLYVYAHLPKTLQMSRADPNTHKVPRQACDIESTKQQHMIQNSLSVQTPNLGS